MKLTKEYKRSGVYRILNQKNKKVYVGSSKNIGKRISAYFTFLVNQLHPNTYLQRAWNKYGPKVFIAEVIEYCEPEELIKKEQYWIDNSSSINYNLCPIAYSQLGRKQSFEEIEKRVSQLRGRKFPPEFGKAISKRMLGKKLSKETKKKISLAKKGVSCSARLKPVLQYKLNGEFVKEWSGLKQIVQELKTNYSSLSMCLTGKNSTHKGFIWKFKKDNTYG